MLEDLISAIASRHGFQPSDFSTVWDAGHFDPARDTHELVITVRDGRWATVQLDAEVRSSPWEHFRKLDTTFWSLAQRTRPRASAETV